MVLIWNSRSNLLFQYPLCLWTNGFGSTEDGRLLNILIEHKNWYILQSQTDLKKMFLAVTA